MELSMNKPLVLICSPDRMRRQRLQNAVLQHELDVRVQATFPTHLDLAVAEPDSESDVAAAELEVHPPDIVVWDASHSLPGERIVSSLRSRSQLVTKLVRVWNSLRFRPKSRRPQDLELLIVEKQAWAPGTAILRVPPGASPEDIARDVAKVASRCWWNELCLLEIPACQVSANGRILRANPTMRRRFGDTAAHGRNLRVDIEGAQEPQLPPLHPLNRTKETRACCSDFVETPRGQLQYVCLPDIVSDDRHVKSITVILPDTGDRTQVFRFAHRHETRHLEEIYNYLVDCAVQLGFKRARLYRYFPDVEMFRGVASRGFRDKKNEDDFVTRFRMPLIEDEPSQDLRKYRVPALCIHDPHYTYEDGRSPILRVYRKKYRNFSAQLELEGANRWIEAPLIVPGSDEIIGKLVVDNGEASDSLNIRDCLDIGYLATMGAGAIHAYYDSRKSSFLEDLFKVLPLFAFEKDDKKFYRAIAAILTCDPGLRWEKTVILVTDPSGTKQATCEMAIGGLEQDDRLHLRELPWDLKQYVLDAIENPQPKDDSLYDSLIVQKSELQVISYGQEDTSSLISEILESTPGGGWEPIDVEKDGWCKKVNERFPGAFRQPRFFVFPLTQSFAFDGAPGRGAVPTQPVGVVIVGMESEERRPELQDLLFTRAVLNVIGTLIAQRWTNQRIMGMCGAFVKFFHTKLKPTFDEVREAITDYMATPNDTRRLKHLEDCIQLHQHEVDQVALAQATFKNVDSSINDRIVLRGFLESQQRIWLAEWGRVNGKGPLRLNIEDISESICVCCNHLVLRDVFTCLVQNAVEAAQCPPESECITVTISAEEISDPAPGIEITVSDDGPGVSKGVKDFLFVQGVTGNEGSRRASKGKGLALARAELLMYAGDLQYVEDSSVHGAVFRIVFHQRQQQDELTAQR